MAIAQRLSHVGGSGTEVRYPPLIAARLARKAAQVMADREGSPVRLWSVKHGTLITIWPRARQDALGAGV